MVYGDAWVYGHTTTIMHYLSTLPSFKGCEGRRTIMAMPDLIAPRLPPPPLKNPRTPLETRGDLYKTLHADVQSTAHGRTHLSSSAKPLLRSPSPRANAAAKIMMVQGGQGGGRAFPCVPGNQTSLYHKMLCRSPNQHKPRTQRPS